MANDIEKIMAEFGCSKSEAELHQTVRELRRELEDDEGMCTHEGTEPDDPIMIENSKLRTENAALKEQVEGMRIQRDVALETCVRVQKALNDPSEGIAAPTKETNNPAPCESIPQTTST